MSTLSDLRQQASDALKAAGVNATEYANETLVPPIAVVIPAEPFVEVGEHYGTYKVSLQILVVSPRGTTKAVADRLDADIERVIIALEDEWDITEVGQPGQVTISNGGQHIAAVVSVSTEIKFKEVI